MSICPKNKTSKSRRNMRRAQSWQIKMPNLVKCEKCGEYRVSHRVCKACGTYKGRAVISMEA